MPQLIRGNFISVHIYGYHYNAIWRWTYKRYNVLCTSDSGGNVSECKWGWDTAKAAKKEHVTYILNS